MIDERNEAWVGAIEAGGTKIVCAVGSSPETLHREQLPTGKDADQTLAEVTHWLAEQQRAHEALRAIGIGSFGPVDLNPTSPSYGTITSTPKAGWRNTDVIGAVRALFPSIPIAFDTDVNAAAFGEHRWGAAVDLEDFVYLTIGTGIGGGGMAGGRLLHGLVHPEMGHMLLQRLPGDDFQGVCPFHGACWEGLCSGPALTKRAGMPVEQIPASDESWAFETQYIGRALANIVCVLSPQRLILGGGVSKAGKLGSERFFQLVRQQVQLTLKDYIVSPALTADIDEFIVPPSLGDDAGICGAIALAQAAIP